MTIELTLLENKVTSTNRSHNHELLTAPAQFQSQPYAATIGRQRMLVGGRRAALGELQMQCSPLQAWHP